LAFAPLSMNTFCMTLKLAIIEDDDFLRAMLVKALSGEGFEVAIDSARPVALIKYLDNHELDVAILDLHLSKGPTGLDLATAIRGKFPEVGIVFLTSYEDPRLLQPNHSPMPKGSVYVVKRQISDLSSLTEAITRAATNMLGSRSEATAVRSKNSVSALTNGQVELLRLLAMGLSNAEIAKRRFITEKSVELSITRLVRALGVERDPTQNQRVHMAKVYFRAMGLKISDDAQ